MSSVPVSVAVHGDRDQRIPFGALRDTLAITQRNLIAYRRVPQLLVFSTIQPVLFVLMFRYVFGGAITLRGPIPYVDFLMPGIFVQTVVFGAIATAIGLATDMKSGLMERFHALPMARSAVLTGRTMADLSRNEFVVILMMIVGFLVGDPESAQAAAFPVLAPLVFASSVVVPPGKMPGWLQVFANHQPVSATASAVRALVNGGPTATYVWQSVVWCVAILVVFAPIAVRLYRRTV